MKYKWLKRGVTPDELSQLLGIKVNSMKSGLIETGETYLEEEEDGSMTELPVVAEGIELDFDGEPTREQIEKVYQLLSNYKELCTRNTKPTPPLTQDEIRAGELLATSPPVITLPEIWELLRIFGRKLGYKGEE